MNRSTFGLSRPWRGGVALVLVAIAVALTLPRYVTGSWVQRAPELRLTPLIELRQTGLAVPGWQTQQQQTITVNGHVWSLQAIAPLDQTSPPADPTDVTPAVTRLPYLLLLRSQTSQTDQPQVEWMDIDGVQSWATDQQQLLRFVVKPSGAASSRSEHSFRSTARLFRGRNSTQTYAVLQWYAWPSGGSPTPARWFLADQVAQWRNRLPLPWVAVCVLMPLDPLADSSSVSPLARQLAQAIHSELVSTFGQIDILHLQNQNPKRRPHRRFGS